MDVLPLPATLAGSGGLGQHGGILRLLLLRHVLLLRLLRLIVLLLLGRLLLRRLLELLLLL
jgi:hypothetical protein